MSRLLHRIRWSPLRFALAAFAADFDRRHREGNTR